MRTLLERAKGSALDIIIGCEGSTDIITPLSSRAQQIRSLNFMYNYWKDIQIFSDAVSGSLPLLRTLEINIVQKFWTPDLFYPSSPLFSNAVNLKQFTLRSRRLPFLGDFVFPNLTTFELSIVPLSDEFQASELFKFLEASPMLQTVHMKIIGNMWLEGVAQRGVVVPSNVQTFSLVMDDGGPTYELAAQISCPSASQTSLICQKDVENITANQDIQNLFPIAASWNTIVRQYTRSPVEAISLEIKTRQGSIISCTLTFRSSDATVIRLGLEVTGDINDEDEFEMDLEDMFLGVFSQASRTIRGHPLLHDAKHLHILHRISLSDYDKVIDMATQVGKLFESIGPLEELILCGCKLHSYLTPFLDLPELEDTEQMITFPHIKELTISHPSLMDDVDECIAAIVKLAKSQHALGVPFERVTVRMEKLPAGIAEMLELWVSVVDCCEERDT